MSDNSNEEYMKEVLYCDYCARCKYCNEPEEEEHCEECLKQPYNYNSHKPVEFVEA